MPLVKWSPLPELEELRRRMDDLSQQSQDRIDAQPSKDTPWQPLADICEEEDRIIINLELPGVAQQDIDLKIEDHQLLVSGERPLPQHEAYQRVEGNYGSFSRIFALPPGIREADINARCECGILRIVLPKVPAGKPKQIVVEAD